MAVISSKHSPFKFCHGLTGYTLQQEDAGKSVKVQKHFARGYIKLMTHKINWAKLILKLKLSPPNREVQV